MNFIKHCEIHLMRLLKAHTNTNAFFVQYSCRISEAYLIKAKTVNITQIEVEQSLAPDTILSEVFELFIVNNWKTSM